MATKAAELYEEDHYAWTRDQAAALRRLAQAHWNGPLDLEHLAEEIEDVGKAERNAVRSQLRRVIEHALKLEHSQAIQPRSGWMASIIDARGEIEDRLTRSMRVEVEADLDQLHARAARKAMLGLLEHGERDAARAVPDDRCPYTLDDLLRDGWYPANRHGIVEPQD